MIEPAKTTDGRISKSERTEGHQGANKDFLPFPIVLFSVSWRSSCRPLSPSNFRRVGRSCLDDGLEDAGRDVAASTRSASCMSASRGAEWPLSVPGDYVKNQWEQRGKVIRSVASKGQ